MHNKTISELATSLEQGDISSVELTKHFLQRIKTHNPDLNAFITITEEQAMRSAEVADQRRAAGQATKLTGIPMAHKDCFCTEGVKSSAASKILTPYVSTYDATMVAQLKAAGMVMLGKTNMDECAMGSSNENSFYGPCHNPWDVARVPGGSSGGSAVAVAAGLIPGATGSDTGGSIRQPAAFCGITGIKPSYGRVSRYGLIAFASSLDQAGPMARSAEDVALMLQAMSGFDPKDSTSVNEDVPDYARRLDNSIKGLKIGLPEQYFKGLDSRIADKIMDAAKTLEKAGASLHEVKLPNMSLSVPAYYVIAPAEASSNLARYDGVRYGYRCDNPKNLEDLYKRSRGEGFGAEVKRRIMVGTYVLSAGYYDAYYRKAQKVRRLISNDFNTVFKDVDVLLGSTTPSTAFKIGEKIDDDIEMYLSDLYTTAVNLAGLPAMSAPAGFIDDLPIGLHLVGKPLEEATLLNVAHCYQQHTDWHQQRPTTFE
ncbi:MAG: Asp-tRNA(Asn)/Glu-tRNA(Gln) amidotransferase subunit GatA [Pseudomonadota bacterium]